MPRTFPDLSPLPIDEILPDLVDAAREHRAVVLLSPTGSGKTTRVPGALLDGGQIKPGQRVVMLEPRRLAARAAARRIAQERRVALGDEVGYAVRFDQRSSDATRLLVVTEGVLLRMLQDDPLLSDVGAIVFDEFHERSLDADLGLAMAARVRDQVRPDLVLAVMSATLDPEPVSAFLGGCPVVESSGRLHPVEISYADRRLSRDRRGIIAGVAGGVRRVLGETDGDLLVFLPGVGEIRAVHEGLESTARRHGVELVDLYGDLPPEAQDRALGELGRRKVVLATNVAESSVTVAGVTGVVDSGLARILRSDSGSGLDRLELVQVSRASADQRAGRAGRERPGVARRLWTEHEHAALPATEAPEIARVDLAGAVLELVAWGEGDLDAFPWFERPKAAALEAARDLLRRLGAVEVRGDGGAALSLTHLGRALARLPVHPRLARLLVEGHRRGVLGRAALLAALLSERPPFGRSPHPGDPRQAVTWRSDLLGQMDVLERFERSGDEGDHPFGPLKRGAARFVLDVARRLARRTEAALGPVGSRSDDPREDLLEAVFLAHPDRLVRARTDGGDSGVMVGGRGVRLAAESGVRGEELYVAVEVAGARPGVHSEDLVRSASAVSREWLPEHLVSTATEAFYDRDRDRVLARRLTRYEDLVIDAKEVPVDDGAVAARRLAEAVAADPALLERALPADDRDLQGFLERVRFLAHHAPELELPELSRERLAELVPVLAAGGARTLRELARAPWLDTLRGSLSYPQLQALDREAPERIEVPSGSRLRLTYRGQEAPVLPVRIQEMFGATDTPRVARGRVPVLLHLLAPNMRPQQVTDDLAGFWRRTYALVKKDLAGRYPKHAWPDDPASARPQRRPGRRSS